MRRAAALVLMLAGCRQYDGPTPQGFAFTSQSITLPAETATLAATPAGELVTNQCAACHSLDLIARQPRLKPEQWAASVKKMREAYHAPIAESDDPQLVAALVALQEGRR